MRLINLTDEERNDLKKLQRKSKNAVVRFRIRCLLLSDKGFSMAEVARQTDSNWLKVVRLFNAWEKASPDEKLATLSIKKGRGSKLKLKKVSHVLPELIEKNGLKLDNVLHVLETDYKVKVCKLTLQKFLKTHMQKSV